MTANLLERVLWELSVNGSSRRRFKEDPQKYLASWRLSESERRMVQTFDVAAMAALGVSPLLTMGYWMEAEGSRDLAAYLARMRGTAPHG